MPDLCIHKRGFTQVAIVSDLGVSQGTISREMARNNGLRGYRFRQAHRFAVQRCSARKSAARVMTPCLIARVGDWELDSIVGAKHKGAITSMVERKTKLTKLVLLKERTSSATKAGIIARLEPLKEHVLTLTSDNGKEFVSHGKISEKLDSDFYFYHPYHSWERGLNENTNGLVRQYFPKNTDFAKLTPADVQRVENLLNNRPRKTLGYHSPNEVFDKLKTASQNYALGM